MNTSVYLVTCGVAHDAWMGALKIWNRIYFIFTYEKKGKCLQRTCFRFCSFLSCLSFLFSRPPLSILCCSSLRWWGLKALSLRVRVMEIYQLAGLWRVLRKRRGQSVLLSSALAQQLELSCDASVCFLVSTSLAPIYFTGRQRLRLGRAWKKVAQTWYFSPSDFSVV